MLFPVLLDACALIPMPEADLLLRIAAAKQYRPLWTDEILDEVEKNLMVKLGRTPVQARRRVDRMREAFPHAMVDGHRPLIPQMTNDPKDRHVLAAAVRGNASLIVTWNVRDFPPESLVPYEVEVRTSDDFLCDQLDLAEPAVLTSVEECVAQLRRPVVSMGEYIERISGALPLFAAALRESGISERMVSPGD